MTFPIVRARARSPCSFHEALLLCLVTLPCAAAPEEPLGIKWLYGEDDTYEILSSADDDTPIRSPVRALTNPGGAPGANPTTVAADGLRHILSGRVDEARDAAVWLIGHAIPRNDALFFSLGFDYAPFWPYKLKAPWHSALTQGLALSLCAYLYQTTGESQHLEWADAIYRSFLVPVDKGGITRFERDGPFFEEFPTRAPSRVLRGATVAMLAVHDYAYITDNAQAMTLFRRSVTRLESLLPQYETLTPHGIVGSRYSLSPSRPEVLGRFRGTAQLFVTGMALYGHRDDTRDLLGAVDVGRAGDDDAASDLYVWPHPEFTNWGPPRAAAAISGRQVNGTAGIYNHSPFRFFVDQQEKYEAYSLEVAWSGVPHAMEQLSEGRGTPLFRYRKRKSQKRVRLELHDGQSYISIGEIRPADADGSERSEFVVSPELLARCLARDKPVAPLDERYLDDHQQSVQLIADLADSQIVRAHAENWKDSLDLVPARSFNRFPSSLFVEVQPSPVIPIMEGGDESVHAEYPCVIDVNGTLRMYYCAYGESRQWRLFHATSTDGREWIRQGELLDRSRLPPEARGRAAFPCVVPDVTSSGGYLLYFSASSEPAEPYQKIYHARSTDGVHWSYGGVAMDDGGLDPLIVVSPEKRYEMYYTKAHGRHASIRHAVSTDGREFTETAAVLTFAAGRRGLYTLSGFYLDDRFLLFAESVTPKLRHDTLLWIREGDRFEPFGGNPLIIDQDWSRRWDAIRYGFHFVSHSGKTLLFYNGISKLGAEEGGQIGMAELDLARLKRRIGRHGH